MESVRGALIDDVALAAAVKKGGRIWLGHSDLARSVRPYPAVARHLADDRAHGLRAAALLAAVAGRGRRLGMALTWLVPPALALFGHGAAFWCGLTPG